MRNSTIFYPVKMEYWWDFNILGLKMIMKSGSEEMFLKFLHAHWEIIKTFFYFIEKRIFAKVRHRGISKRIFVFYVQVKYLFQIPLPFHNILASSTPIIKSIIVVGFEYYNSLRPSSASLIFNFLVKLILSYSWRLMSHFMKKSIFCFPHPNLLLVIQNPVWFQWTGSRLKRLTTENSFVFVFKNS